MAETDFLWFVPPNLPACEGHFEGNPVVPGVVLLDQAWRRAQAFWADGAEKEGQFSDWEITQAKFLSPVKPGEVLKIKLEASDKGGIRFKIHGGGRCVASGLFTPTQP